MLSQLDHIVVEVLIACTTTPRFRTWFVKNTGTGTHCCRVGPFDVVNGQSDLYARGRLPFRRIESEMEVGPFSPGDLGVRSAYPPVVHPIVTWMEVQAERVSVKSHRTVEVGNLQNDRHQPAVLGHRHPFRVVSDPRYASHAADPTTMMGRSHGPRVCRSWPANFRRRGRGPRLGPARVRGEP